MKNGKSKILIAIGVICLVAVIVILVFAATGNNSFNDEKIDPDKAIAWEEYVDRYNAYASQNDLHLMSKSVDSGDSYTMGEFNGLRGEFWVEDGYMDSVSIDALSFDQVEPYLYGLLRSFDPSINIQDVQNLLAGLDVKSDGYSQYIESNLGKLENYSGDIRKDGGLYDISVYARYHDYD